MAYQPGSPILRQIKTLLTMIRTRRVMRITQVKSSMPPRSPIKAAIPSIFRTNSFSQKDDLAYARTHLMISIFGYPAQKQQLFVVCNI